MKFKIAALLICFIFMNNLKLQALVPKFQKPLVSKVIAIDPGHGGYDPGATWGKLKEKEINLAMAKMLKANLEAKGAKVILTRDGDYNHAIKGLHGLEAKRYDLKQRIDLVHSSKADILLTIHVNSSKNTNSAGAETFYHPKSQQGKILAEAIQEELRKVPGMKKRIAKQSTFYMLRNTKIPAVLVEIGYLSNARERNNLQKESYLMTLTEKITQGIINYFASKKINEAR